MCPRILLMAEEQHITDALSRHYTDEFEVLSEGEPFSNLLNHLCGRPRARACVNISILDSLDHRYDVSLLSSIQMKSLYPIFLNFYEQIQRGGGKWDAKGHPLASWNVCLHYFHLLAYYIAGVLQQHKVDVCVFFNIPHCAWDMLIYQIADVLGIRHIVLMQSIFKNRYCSMESYLDLGTIEWATMPAPQTVRSIEKDRNQSHFYMKDISKDQENISQLGMKDIKRLLVYLVRRELATVLKPMMCLKVLRRMHKVKRFFPIYRAPFQSFFNLELLRYFERLSALENTQVNFEEDYIYFPLQLQPEISTHPMGGRYVDQALAIEHLSLILPKGYRIYIKENPKQINFRRSFLFFKRLKQLPSIMMVPSHTSTHRLTNHAKCVATVGGTVGWEAICKGKPVINFGSPWYKSLPGNFTFHFNLDLASIIRQTIDHKRLEFCFSQLVASLPEGIIDAHYQTLLGENEFCAAHNAKGIAGYIADLIMNRKRCVYGDAS